MGVLGGVGRGRGALARKEVWAAGGGNGLAGSKSAANLYTVCVVTSHFDRAQLDGGVQLHDPHRALAILFVQGGGGNSNPMSGIPRCERDDSVQAQAPTGWLARQGTIHPIRPSAGGGNRRRLGHGR